MKALKLRPHGEYVNSLYQSLKSETEGAIGASPPEERPDDNVSGVLTRFEKRSKAHDNPLAFGWIKTVYTDAIEYTRAGTGVRGLGLFVSVSAFAVSCAAMWVALGIIGFGGLIFSVLGGAFLTAVISFAVLLPLWNFRLEMFRPEDEPVIFDRKHRKVYRITRESAPGIAGLFKPWPMVALSYDWDLIDVEHNADLMVSTNMAKRQHALVFLVRRSADDPTIIDSFDIGNRMALGEASVPCVWEHIRRFMEESGPHLPRGDKLAPVREPKSMWEGIKQVAQYHGGGFRQWFRDGHLVPWLIVFLFPIFGPMTLFWGIGNYLAYKTSIPIRWPDEVSEAIGPPLASERHA